MTGGTWVSVGKYELAFLFRQFREVIAEGGIVFSGFPPDDEIRFLKDVVCPAQDPAEGCRCKRAVTPDSW